jgi:senataxin
MSPTEHLYSGQRLKISAYKIIKTKGMDATKLTAVLKRGNIMPSSFRISRNYFYLRPGEVYSYDEKLPYIHSKTDLRASHAVMTIGTGHEDDQTEVGNEDAQVETQETKKLRHIVMQNSEGNLFGVDGKGRVDQNSIRQLCLLKV